MLSKLFQDQLSDRFVYLFVGSIKGEQSIVEDNEVEYGGPPEFLFECLALLVISWLRDRASVMHPLLALKSDLIGKLH